MEDIKRELDAIWDILLDEGGRWRTGRAVSSNAAR